MGSAGGRIVKQQCPHVRALRDTKGKADNAGLSVKVSNRLKSAREVKWANGGAPLRRFSLSGQVQRLHSTQPTSRLPTRSMYVVPTASQNPTVREPRLTLAMGSNLFPCSRLDQEQNTNNADSRGADSTCQRLPPISASSTASSATL